MAVAEGESISLDTKNGNSSPGHSNSNMGWRVAHGLQEGMRRTRVALPNEVERVLFVFRELGVPLLDRVGESFRLVKKYNQN